MNSKRLMLVAAGCGVVLVVALAWWFIRPAPAEVDIASALEAATASAYGAIDHERGRDYDCRVRRRVDRFRRRH